MAREDRARIEMADQVAVVPDAPPVKTEIVGDFLESVATRRNSGMRAAFRAHALGKSWDRATRETWLARWTEFPRLPA